MKTLRIVVPRCVLLGILMVTGIVSAPVRVAAQTGEKAVYNASGLTSSSAWVDASAFCPSGGTNNCANIPDFCNIVSQALTQLLQSNISPAGGVVDARGVLPISITQSPEPCTSNPFPSNLGSVPITILLPAYSIQLNSYGTNDGAWVIPNNVKLVGSGFQTILVSGSISAPYMVEMGQPPTGSCSTVYNGIGIEHLQINTAIGGIDNQCAGPGSYVSDVKIAGQPPIAPSAPLGGTALNVGAGATNSGPYSNLYVVTVPYNSCGATAPAVSCVVLGAQTRGIHGLTCVGSDASGAPPQSGSGIASGSAGVVVNASNNSVQDVHVESFYDGIQIGANATAADPVGNVSVSDAEAGNTSSCNYGGVANAVHVCGPNVPPSNQTYKNYACSTQGGYGSVTDVAMVGISNGPFAQPPFSSVQDDQIGTVIQGCNGQTCMDPITSGTYILGRPSGGTGPYSRFAINPANSTVYGGVTTFVPTWGVGNTGVPSGPCEVPGAIYSYTGSSGGSPSFFICSAGVWQHP